MLDPNAPGGSVEIGVADNTVQIKSSQDRDWEGYLLAALDSTAGALANPEASPELGLGLVEAETDVGYSLKFHARSLAGLPAEITYHFC